MHAAGGARKDRRRPLAAPLGVARFPWHARRSDRPLVVWVGRVAHRIALPQLGELAAVGAELLDDLSNVSRITGRRRRPWA